MESCNPKITVDGLPLPEITMTRNVLGGNAAISPNRPPTSSPISRNLLSVSYNHLWAPTPQIGYTNMVRNRVQRLGSIRNHPLRRVRSRSMIPPPMSRDGSPLPNVAPHRGFNEKAREVLIGTDDMHLPYGSFRGMPNKSVSEFDLRKKLKSLGKQGSKNGSPKSNSSTSSIPENAPIFDTIGEASIVKKHPRLHEIGKARSCADFKSDKPSLRTYQEDNILKMPSIDSDIGSSNPNPIDQLCFDLEGIGKSLVYMESKNDSNNANKNGKK